MLILDASGSMWGRIDGRTKIEIARTTIKQILTNWHHEDRLGLMAYGHRSRTDCRDIEILHPPEPLDAKSFNAAVARIMPKGMTPMTEAVRQAAAALGYTEQPATIILVTDGEETCHADPCAVADELVRTGVRLTIHVIGFDINDDKTKAQLACFTKKTSGLLLDAHNAGELSKAFAKTVEVIQKPPPPPPPAEMKPALAAPKEVRAEPELAEPKPVPVEPHPVVVAPPQPPPGPNLSATARLAAGGPALEMLDRWKAFATYLRWDLYSGDADESTAKPLQEKTGGHTALIVGPGSYRLRATLGNLSVEQPVTVAADHPAAVDLVLGLGAVEVAAKAVSDVGASSDQIRVEFLDQAGNALGERYGALSRFPAKPGPYRIRATLDQAVVERAVTIAAGQIARLDIALGIGRITPHVVSPLDNSEVMGDIGFAVLGREKSAQGEDVTIQTAYGPDAHFDLPAGRYRLRANVGKASGESEFQVIAGETAPVQIALDIGRLVAHVYQEQGGKEIVADPYFTVLAPERDAQGQEVTVATAAKAGAAFDLPIGRYKLRATVGQTSGESEVEIKPGAVTSGDVILSFGRLEAHAYLGEGGKEIVDDPYFTVLAPTKTAQGNEVTIATGVKPGAVFELPTGRYKLRVLVGKATAESDVEVAPGAVTIGKVIVNYGRLVVHAFLHAGGSEISDDIGFRVLALEKNAEGDEVTIATAYNPGAAIDLNAGRYRLRAAAGKAIKEQEIEIKTGATTAADLDLNAGIVAVDAPGAAKIEILPEADGASGALFDRSYQPKHSFVLPAGKYLVRALRDDKSPIGEKAIDLAANDRISIALP